MKAQDSLSGKQTIPQQYLLDAVRQYWGDNKHLDLRDLIHDTRHLTNIRAFLPTPHCAFSTDTVGAALHNVSKLGVMPKPVMTGSQTMEEYKASRMDRTTLSRMRGYMQGRSSFYSQEFEEFRNTEEWRIVQSTMRRRHDFTCQICRADKGGCAGELDCHHHSYGDGSFEAFIALDNIWLLCSSCHSIVHFLRDLNKDSEAVAETLFACCVADD